MKRTNKKGFTLVELVIVIAIIAILAAVLIPTFSGVVAKAKESAALQKARNAYTECMTATEADLPRLGTDAIAADTTALTGSTLTVEADKTALLTAIKEAISETGVTSVAYSGGTFTVVVDGMTYTYTAAAGWKKTA